MSKNNDVLSNFVSYLERKNKEEVQKLDKMAAKALSLMRPRVLDADKQ